MSASDCMTRRYRRHTYTLYSAAVQLEAVMKLTRILYPFVADDTASVQAMKFQLSEDDLYHNLLHFSTHISHLTATDILALPDQFLLENTPNNKR